jgi:hypothetical protein
MSSQMMTLGKLSLCGMSSELRVEVGILSKTNERLSI